jgi:hypothetical protein
VCLPLIGRKKNPLKLEVGEVVREHELQVEVKQLEGLGFVVVRGLGLGVEWVWGFW